MSRSTIAVFLILGAAAFGLAARAGAGPIPSVAAGAADKAPTIVGQWSGTIDDEALQAKAPEGGRVLDAKSWDALREAWKLPAEAKKIDPAKHLILVATTRGSRLIGRPMLDEKGNLTFAPISTRDLRPGFRCLVVAVPREGVKSVNGKPLE